MGRDSNPRCTNAHSSFQDCRLRPLGHPSTSFDPRQLRQSPVAWFAVFEVNYIKLRGLMIARRQICHL